MKVNGNVQNKILKISIMSKKEINKLQIVIPDVKLGVQHSTKR